MKMDVEQLFLVEKTPLRRDSLATPIPHHTPQECKTFERVVEQKGINSALNAQRKTESYQSYQTGLKDWENGEIRSVHTGHSTSMREKTTTILQTTISNTPLLQTSRDPKIRISI